MQPDGSESDSMADYSTTAQPDRANIQEKVQWVSVTIVTFNFSSLQPITRYGDGAGNTVEENSSVFSLIRMRY